MADDTRTFPAGTGFHEATMRLPAGKWLIVTRHDKTWLIVTRHDKTLTAIDASNGLPESLPEGAASWLLYAKRG